MCSELIFYRIADFLTCIYKDLSTLSRCYFDKYLIFCCCCYSVSWSPDSSLTFQRLIKNQITLDVLNM